MSSAWIKTTQGVEMFIGPIFISEDEGLKTIGIYLEFKIRDILIGVGVISLLAISVIAGIRI